ncbi:MAG: hypothetical protein HY816_22535 [Candidatus Wallbacteria bacterium]|nr:hypothetical protein [Candidatus Wallbacteria bacterium]
MLLRTFARYSLAALTGVCLTSAALAGTDAPGLKKDDVIGLIKGFRAADKNHNGVLSHDELATRFNWTVPAGHEHKADDKAHGFSKIALIRMIHDFLKIDADKDGVLSHGELMSFYHPAKKSHEGCDHARCEKAQKGECCGKCEHPTKCEKAAADVAAGKCPKTGKSCPEAKTCPEAAKACPRAASACAKTEEVCPKTGKTGSCPKADCAKKASCKKSARHHWRHHRHCPTAAEATLL